MNADDLNRVMATVEALRTMWVIWEDRRVLRWYHLVAIVVIVCTVVVLSALRTWLDSWSDDVREAMQDEGEDEGDKGGAT